MAALVHFQSTDGSSSALSVHRLLPCLLVSYVSVLAVHACVCGLCLFALLTVWHSADDFGNFIRTPEKVHSHHQDVPATIPSATMAQYRQQRGVIDPTFDARRLSQITDRGLFDLSALSAHPLPSLHLLLSLQHLCSLPLLPISSLTSTVWQVFSSKKGRLLLWLIARVSCNRYETDKRKQNATCSRASTVNRLRLESELGLITRVWLESAIVLNEHA